MQTNPEQCFLLVKRGLYYAPNNQGYTGVKDRAGRYREVDALGLDGVTAIHEDKAPLFAPACWQETKAEFYEAKIAAFAERESRLVGAITSANAMACTPDSDGSHKITLHYPDTATAMAAFVQLSDVADDGMKDRTHG